MTIRSYHCSSFCKLSRKLLCVMVCVHLFKLWPAELAPQFDADNVMSGLNSLTGQQLASNVGGRHENVGCGRVSQELGHSLKEHGPFDLVIIMAWDQLPWCIRTSEDNHARRPGVARYPVTGLEFGLCSFHCTRRVAPNGMFRDATCTRHDGSIST